MAQRMLRNGETIGQNKKARFEYTIIDSLEVGIVLQGAEVKALRLYGASLQECHAAVSNGKLMLFNLNIKEYPFTPSHLRFDAIRPRALLMRQRQINKWLGAVQKEGNTIVPLRMYFTDRGLVKLELALAKGKKAHDKRATIKERDWNREKAQLLKLRS